MMLLYKAFINTISATTLVYLAHAMYSFQREKEVYIKFIIIASISANVLFYLDKYIKIELRAILGLIIMGLLSYLILKLSLIQSIVINVINAIALAIGDLSAVFVMVKIYRYSLEDINSSVSLSLASELIIYGTVLVIILLIRLVTQSREMTDKYRRIISIKTSVYMLVTFIIIVFNISIYINFIGLINQNIILASAVMMWLYLILSLYINFTNSALALKEQQYDQQQDYIRTIDNLINEFRRLKHSYANTIYCFYGYIQEYDLPGLKTYYTELIGGLKTTDSNLLLALQQIKIYAIFGLLWNKINKAESKGIEVGIQVIKEVREAGIKLTDLCEILGNYLDNAIDAAAEAEIKKINISLIDDEGYLTIRIENTYSGVVKVEDVQRKGFSTKGSGRGFGLAITNKILHQYTNVLNNTSAEDGIFRQELIIKR